MLQILLNGVIQGSLFALLGLAFSMVHSATRVFHLALGAVFTVAPYLALLGMTHGIPWPAAVLGALIVSAILGATCEAVVHWPLERARASADVHFVSSLGAFLVIVQAVALIWGSEPHVLRSGMDLVYEFAGLRLTRGQILEFGLCTACLASVAVWLWRSETGLGFRALASNPVLMSVLGANIRRLRLQIFAVSGILTGICALLTSFDVGFDADTGMRAVLIAVAASIVGGRTSLIGVVAAGLLFGVLQAAVVWYTSARWVDAATFAVLAAVLLFLPRGLAGIGRTTRLEEAS